MSAPLKSPAALRAGCYLAACEVVNICQTGNPWRKEPPQPARAAIQASGGTDVAGQAPDRPTASLEGLGGGCRK